MKIVFLKLFESTLTGIKEIFYNKTRSILTMLGIMLGVASLITMASIVEGAREGTIAIMNQWGGLKNVSLEYTGEESEGSGDFSFGAKRSGLTFTDVDELYQNHADIIDTISPELRYRGLIKRHDRSLRVFRVVGVTPAFAEIGQYTIRDGRGLSVLDDWSLARVCVIGTIIKDELFEEYENPVGEKLDIDGVTLTVVGVFSHFQMTDPLRPGTGQNDQKKKPDKNVVEYAIKPADKTEPRMSNRGFWRKYGSGNVLWFKNLIVCIPFSTMQVMLKGDNYIDSVNILLKDSDRLAEKVSMMSATLKKSRSAEDFEMNTAAENFEMMNKQIGIFNIVLGSIAAISLIVGGIGIMNVILASISQRIREIGVRKSVGASDADIFVQFLIETMILAMMGGFTGIILSFFSAALISGLSGLNASISPVSILISLVFSGVVGVVFGIYPAVKASRLNPITALRYE